MLAVLVAAYLVAAYRPFRWEPPRVRNTVEVSPTGSLRFDGTAMARGAEPLRWPRTAIERGEVALELTARTSDPDQRGPARLLALAVDHRRSNLAVGQQGDDLVVRVGPGAGTVALRVEDVFDDGSWHDVLVEVSQRSASVAVDGTERRTVPLEEDPFRSWYTGAELALGNEVTGSRGWSGELRHAEVRTGGSAVDLLDPASYVLPAGWWAKPVTDVYVEPDDVVRNVLGFVPFGAVVVLVAPGRRRALRAGAAALVLSAAMEGGQLVVVGRDPSLVDLLANTTGGALGGLVVGLVRWRTQAP